MPSATSSIILRPTMSPPSVPPHPCTCWQGLSGEGADEIFGGYLYFHKAPTAKDFHEETVRKLSKLHLYDCLRANKSLSAWGVEGRVPFLDKEFLDVAMRTNPEAKMCPGNTMEKKIVREAFADMLPAEVAWRQKEQFSDGVGYSWIDTLKAVTVSPSIHPRTRRNITIAASLPSTSPATPPPAAFPARPAWPVAQPSPLSGTKPLRT